MIEIPLLLALLVVLVAMPLNWYVTLRLWSLSRSKPGIRVLRADAIAALALALIVTVFSMVFVNNGLDDPFFDTPTTQLITRSVLLIFSVIPALHWLRLYRRRA